MWVLGREKARIGFSDERNQMVWRCDYGERCLFGRRVLRLSEGVGTRSVACVWGVVDKRNGN